MRRWALIYLFSSVIFGLPPPVPSAGVVERELEKEYESEPVEPEKKIPNIQIDIPDKHYKLPIGISVGVSRIKIEGNKAISCEEILSWIEPHISPEETCEKEPHVKKLSIQDIYGLCAIIDQEYAKRGYFLARAYPPPQVVRNGLLRIVIIEGRLGSVQVDGNQFYSEQFIQSFFSKLKSKPLQYDSFMRALLLLNENSDLRAAAVFSKGKEQGTADVILKIKDKRPLHLYLNGNNYGENITTNFRVGGRFDAGSLITFGDKLSLAEVVGFPFNALYFTDLVYRFPVSRDGDFLEVAYLFSKFKVEELKTLNLRGASNIGTIKYTRNLTRSRIMSVDLFGYFDIKQIQNYVLGTLTAFDKLRVLTTGFFIDRYSSPKRREYLNIRFGVGIPDFLGGMNPVSSKCSTIGAGGLFVKFNADFDHLQYLAKDYVLSLHGSGQYSPYKLAIPEEIYIGGIETVRGYPLAVALGNSGFYGNIEFRIPPPLLANQRFFVVKKKWKEVIQLVAFLDSGGVFMKGGSSTILWGTGFGFRFKGPGNLSLSVDLGYPLNHNNLSNGMMVYIKAAGQVF